MHFTPVSLARLAPSALDVEGKASRFEALRLGVLGFCKQVADVAEQPGVGRRIGARGAPDGALIDGNHLVQMLRALDAVEFAGVGHGVVELFRKVRVQNVVDQRGFARSGHAGDTDKAPQRNVNVQMLEVVLRRAADLQEIPGSPAGGLPAPECAVCPTDMRP